MKYDHIVKINGSYYEAGVDVPEEAFVAESGAEEPIMDTPEEAPNMDAAEGVPARRGRPPKK